MNQFLLGAVAGLAGSVAHSVTMLALHRALPRARREPVPPTQITTALASRVRIVPAHGRLRTLATAVLHFAYGAGAGALYARVAPAAVRRPLATGIAFGIGVWGASYLGWLPAASLVRPATADAPARNLMMVLAHVAWGATLGTVFERLRRRRASSRFLPAGGVPGEPRQVRLASKRLRR